MKQFKQKKLNEFEEFKATVAHLEENSKSFNAYIEALKTSNKACFSQTSLKNWLKKKRSVK